MRRITVIGIVFAVTCVLGLSSTAHAQQAAAPAGGQELYHVHFVKSAPGKLQELIDAYVSAPVEASAPGPPVILRHIEGDDWQLLVISPLGPEETLRPTPSAEEQQFRTRTRALRTEHTDTFAVGPAWSEARKILAAGDAKSSGGGAGAVYVVSTMRSLPGHRDQLMGVIEKDRAQNAATTLVLQHSDGASWDLVAIARYDSWTAFGESLQKERGQALLSPTSAGLGEHMAEHHDTMCERVTGSAPPR